MDLQDFDLIVQTQVEDFISSKDTVTYLDIGVGRVFVRSLPVFLDSFEMKFDIAIVQIDEQFQSKGYFKSFLQICIKTLLRYSQYTYLYVENAGDKIQSHLDKNIRWEKVLVNGMYSSYRLPL